MVTENIMQMTGIEAESWVQCAYNASSYFDCPTASMGNDSLYIAVQNPSSVDLSVARVLVERGTYNASRFNMTSQSFEYAPSTLICHNDSTLDLDHIDSCSLSVEVYT